MGGGGGGEGEGKGFPCDVSLTPKLAKNIDFSQFIICCWPGLDTSLDVTESKIGLS